MRIARVHGGVALGWVSSDLEIECNAYCGNGLHCSLIYTSASATEDEVRRAAGPHFPNLEKVVRAPEAPPPDLAEWMLVSGPLRAGDQVEGWLVFWRETP